MVTLFLVCDIFIYTVGGKQAFVCQKNSRQLTWRLYNYIMHERALSLSVNQHALYTCIQQCTVYFEWLKINTILYVTNYHFNLCTIAMLAFWVHNGSVLCRYRRPSLFYEDNTEGRHSVQVSPHITFQCIFYLMFILFLIKVLTATSCFIFIV